MIVGILNVWIVNFPEQRFLSLGWVKPIFSFFGPIFQIFVSTSFVKLKVFPVWYKHLTRFEGFCLDWLVPEFIIPSISFSCLLLSGPLFLELIYMNKFIFWDFLQSTSKVWTLFEPFWLPNLSNWKPTNDYWWGLKVNTFMLNAHKDNPHIALPCKDFLFTFLNQIDYHLLDSVSEMFGILDRGPLVMGLIQVVPVHLINSNSEHSFVLFVDSALDQSLVNQLVDKKGRCMPKVKDKRVSQGLGLCVVRAVIFYDCE